MNKSNFEHALYALIMQLVPGLLFGDYISGATFAVGFYLSREINSNQTKKAFWKRHPGEPLPYHVPDVKWYESLTGWGTDSKLDWLFPFVAVSVGAVIHYFIVPLIGQ